MPKVAHAQWDWALPLSPRAIAPYAICIALIAGYGMGAVWAWLALALCYAAWPSPSACAPSAVALRSGQWYVKREGQWHRWPQRPRLLMTPWCLWVGVSGASVLVCSAMLPPEQWRRLRVSYYAQSLQTH